MENKDDYQDIIDDEYLDEIMKLLEKLSNNQEKEIEKLPDIDDPYWEE